MVVDARARGGCTCAEEGCRKGAQLVIYFVLYVCRLGGVSQDQCRVYLVWVLVIGFTGSMSCVEKEFILVPRKFEEYKGCLRSDL